MWKSLLPEWGSLSPVDKDDEATEIIFSCGEHRVGGVANTSFWRISRQIGSEWRRLWRQTPHRLYHFKLDLPISLLYFWRSRRKPTVVTLNHFGLYETICRHAKAFVRWPTRDSLQRKRNAAKKKQSLQTKKWTLQTKKWMLQTKKWSLQIKKSDCCK